MYGWFTIIHVFTTSISCYSVELEVRMSAPTYKELIQLVNEAESVTSSHHGVLSTAEVLTMNFSHLYPHIKIGRPGRLKGCCQKPYLKRVWLPRIRNENIQSEGTLTIDNCSICGS